MCSRWSAAATVHGRMAQGREYRLASAHQCLPQGQDFVALIELPGPSKEDIAVLAGASVRLSRGDQDMRGETERAAVARPRGLLQAPSLLLNEGS
jgi:hypothetical protein